MLVTIALKKCFTSEQKVTQLVPGKTEPPVMIIEQVDLRLKAPYSPEDKQVIVQKFLVSSRSQNITNSLHRWPSESS